MPQFFRDPGSRIATHVSTLTTVDMAIDAAIVHVNFYPKGTMMLEHVDHEGGPTIVSISLGDDANFLFGGFNKTDPYIQIPLYSGDVFIWGGPARMCFRGISHVFFGTGPH